jgi:hypothetical protein
MARRSPPIWIRQWRSSATRPLRPWLAIPAIALPLATQGVVLRGKQLVYWLELTQNPDGRVQQGQVWVFQEEWLPKVEEELGQRFPLQVKAR